jgi:hypothetical protein
MSTYDAIDWSAECPCAYRPDPPTLTAGQLLALLVPLQAQQGPEARISVSRATDFSMLLSELIADVQQRQAKSLLGAARPIYIRVNDRRVGIREIQTTACANTLVLE